MVSNSSALTCWARSSSSSGSSSSFTDFTVMVREAVLFANCSGKSSGTGSSTVFSDSASMPRNCSARSGRRRRWPSRNGNSTSSSCTKGVSPTVPLRSAVRMSFHSAPRSTGAMVAKRRRMSSICSSNISSVTSTGSGAMRMDS